MSCGVTSSSILRSCCVVAVAFQIDLLTHLPERGDLALLEIGLGEDLAVHLDEDLLDDLGAGATARERTGNDAERGRRGELCL